MMAKVAVCVSLLLVLLVPSSESSPLKGCCTQYQEIPIPVKVLKSFTFQDIAQHCNIMAVIFRTVKNRRVCANPYSEWVQHAMETVPEQL